MKWFVKVLNQYADFRGRASRREFWMFFLFNILATFAICVIGFGIITWTEIMGVAVLPLVYLMAVWIPCWAVTVRRLHDTSRSAWFFLAALIPLIGGIWLLVVLMTKGVPEENKYGKNPITTTSSHYFRRRSAAVALILSSIFWLFSYLLLFYFSFGWNNNLLISILLPVGLFLAGVMFFSKKMFTHSLASLLIVLAAVWLFLNVLEIQEIYSHLFVDFNIILLISQFVIFVPIALFLSGIYILIKKTDRTVPACLLFAGSFIWIFNILWKTIQFPVPLYNSSAFLSLFNNTPTFLSLLSTTIPIVAPISLLVFARTLLSKEKSLKETKYVYENNSNNSVPKQTRSKSDRRLEDNHALKRIDQPHAASDVEPIVQPEVARSDAGQVFDPIVQPEAGREAELISQPEGGRKVDPIVQPEAGHKDPIVHPEAGRKDPILHPEVERKDLILHPEVERKDLILHPEAGRKDPIVHPEAGRKDPIVHPEADRKVDPIAQSGTIRKVESGTARSQPVISENRKKVVFLREDNDNKNIWVIYKAPSKVDAMAFLSKIMVNRPSYYVVVETSEGNFGRDKDGIYQE